MHALFAEQIEKSFGDRTILRGASLRIVPGEKVGLVGVNGAGKSTLLRILTAQMECDHGRVDLKGRIAYLDQNPILEGPTVLDAISAQTQWHQKLLEDYENALVEGDDEEATKLQNRLDTVGWDLSHSIDSMLTQLSAPEPSTSIEGLSGGEVRRVALAKTLLSGAEVVILDEPTNHLDTATIEWLEAYLSGYRGAVLLVTHDRYLLERVATPIKNTNPSRKPAPMSCSYRSLLSFPIERPRMGPIPVPKPLAIYSAVTPSIAPPPKANRRSPKIVSNKVMAPAQFQAPLTQTKRKISLFFDR